MPGYDESAIASAPLAVDHAAFGGRVFERIRRDAVDGRECAPFENTWLALDRIAFGGVPGLLFHPLESRHRNHCLDADLVERDLTAVGFRVLQRVPGDGGATAVITEDCPGVRLRALVEAVKASRTELPREVVWYLVARTAELGAAWRAAGVQPLDTFVGFDGSVHLFPGMPAAFNWELPSFNGDIVFDPLLVDDQAPQLVQLLCATLPESGYPSPTTMRARRSRPPRAAAIPAELRGLLAGPRTTDDAASELAAIVQGRFPRTHDRHRRVYETLGCELKTWGRAREARILAGSGAHRDSMLPRPGPGLPPELDREAPGGLVAWFRRLWPWGRP